ncbi:MAG: murein L,D-transpeptidase catalytic domain family protein, partial [Pseudomonadota bacterium]
GKVPDNLLAPALNAYDSNKANFPNDDYITVVDFSKRSNKTRFFVINMNSGSVWALRTAHGAGGDLDHDGYVESVSNVSGSHKSSKGFYRVSEVYYGKYGRSIRLDGLSSTNSAARARAIVLHGSDYVQERNVIQGRSWGCFVLAWSVKDDVVSKIASGSLLYADFSGQK